MIKLELTQDEADTLQAILQHVGGSPTVSRRKYMDMISVKLEEAGVFVKYPTEDMDGGSIAFTNIDLSTY